MATAAIFGPWEHGEMTNKLKNRWLEPSHGRQKGRPKKGQKMHSPHELKRGESLSLSC